MLLQCADLKQSKGHEPQCLQVFLRALNEHAITQTVHQKCTDLCSGCQYLLIS